MSMASFLFLLFFGLLLITNKKLDAHPYRIFGLTLIADALTFHYSFKAADACYFEKLNTLLKPNSSNDARWMDIEGLYKNYTILECIAFSF